MIVSIFCEADTFSRLLLTHRWVTSQRLYTQHYLYYSSLHEFWKQRYLIFFLTFTVTFIKHMIKYKSDESTSFLFPTSIKIWIIFSFDSVDPIRGSQASVYLVLDKREGSGCKICAKIYPLWLPHRILETYHRYHMNSKNSHRLPASFEQGSCQIIQETQKVGQH